MAGFDVGSQAQGRRALNHELALVPFIDFLLCLVAFLLVTAVWSQHARLNADANVPGTPQATPAPAPQELHVTATERDFLLQWKQSGTVFAATHVERVPLALADGSLRYPTLERAAKAEWQARGAHRAATDPTQDRVVLHTPNSLEFREVTAMLDALHGPTRGYRSGSASVAVPAFAVALATD
jgi:biopolymer transport protein ExbD